MPVGFENSALKMSFSLSSLEPGGGQGSPQMVRLQAERPYNSLTKKSRTAEEEMWRRSWNIQEEKKDEFWAALQPNYNYLMDNNLIESCKEASGELPGDENDITPLLNWSFKDFSAQFSELCSWLNSIREAVYGKEENIRDRNLRLEHVNAMHRKLYRRKLFTELAERLLAEHSDLKDEVSWRLKYLNTKWDMLEQSISPSKNHPNQEGLFTDVEHEAHCLKEWIREMEGRLKPLNMHVVSEWNIQELAEKVAEYAVLHQDIRAHGKVVAAVLRSAECARATAIIRLAKRLERRWHLLFLRALEWQFHLENLLKRRRRSCSQLHSSDSDEEPVTKHPRLSAENCSDQLTDDGSYFEDDIKDFRVLDISKKNANDAGVPECCLRTDNNSVCGKHKTKKKKCCETRFVKTDVFHKENNTCAISVCVSNGEEISCQNRPKQSSRNFATFHFKHQDMDSEQDLPCQRNNRRASDVVEKACDGKTMFESSDEEWTYTCGKSTQKPQEKGDKFQMSAGLIQSNHTLKSKVAVRLNFDDNDVSKKVCSTGGRCSDTHSDEKYVEGSKVVDEQPNACSKACIQELVSQAELLVREERLLPCEEGSQSQLARHARIHTWVKMHSTDSKCQLPDSCDASGEYTTGESDEDCTLLNSPEEMNDCFLMNKHLEDLLTGSPARSDEMSLGTDISSVGKKNKCSSPLNQEEGCKVVLRGQKRSQRDRPWSVSGVPHLSPIQSQTDSNIIAYLSNSESALHQMYLSPASQVKGLSSSGVHVNKSSSTIGESTIVANEGQIYTSSSLRRRKLRSRKRSLHQSTHKSESGSDGVTPALSGSSDTQQVSSSSLTHRSSLEGNPKAGNVVPRGSLPVSCSLVKSQSFSGSPCSNRVPEQYATTLQMTHQNSKSCNSSETETEEENPSKQKTPMFRLGPDQGVITVKTGLLSPSVVAPRSGDSDVDRAAHGPEEQLSSFSEQAWDNYQEKYMSEPYSEEIADSDTARRLLEFGDDYHKFLDSLSDCPSSLDSSHKVLPPRRRKQIGGGGGSLLDSDSDLEDIQHLIRQSQSQLAFTMQVLNKQLANVSPDKKASDYAQIIATCKENKHCLRVILENASDELLSQNDCKEIADLLGKWSCLDEHAQDLQRALGLHHELASLHKELLDLSCRAASLVDDIRDRSDLESRMKLAKDHLSVLMEHKKHLLHLNVAVHHLVTERDSRNTAIVPSPTDLKNAVTGVYQIWSDSFQSVSTQMDRLERAVDTWRVFDTQLSHLQAALQDDHKALTLLCCALEGGLQMPVAVAASLQGTAVPHSTRTSPPCQGNSIDAVIVPEGSLSDSGISDSGSEQELSERARRVAALRRLARLLRTQVVPTAAALADIDKHIEVLDCELHQLQDVCRDLPLPPALSVDASNSLCIEKPIALNMPSTETRGLSPCAETKRPRESVQKKRSVAEGRSKWHRPWLRRVLCSALPFQLALLALLCMSSFWEPHCCDVANNLNLPLSPQLRYIRGPPPV